MAPCDASGMETEAGQEAAPRRSDRARKRVSDGGCTGTRLQLTFLDVDGMAMLWLAACQRYRMIDAADADRLGLGLVTIDTPFVSLVPYRQV